MNTHRPLRPLTFKTALSKARKFAGMPGFREHALLYLSHARRLATTAKQRAAVDALVIPDYSSPFEGERA